MRIILLFILSLKLVAEVAITRIEIDPASVQGQTDTDNSNAELSKWIEISEGNALIADRNSFNQMNVPKERFIDLLAQVKSGTRSHINVLSIGDSLTAKVSTRLWQDYLSEQFIDPSIVKHPYWNSAANNGEGMENYGLYGNGVSHYLNGKLWKQKSNYNLNFTGTYFDLEANETVNVTRILNSVHFANKIIIPYYKSSEAGTFRVKLATDPNTGGFNPTLNYQTPQNSNVSLTNGELIVDANSSEPGLGIIELYLDSTVGASYQVEYISGGTVKFFPPSFYIENDSAIPTINVQHHGRGSNNFINTEEASVPLMSQWIDALRPDIITVQSDDRGGAYENFLPMLYQAISGSTVKPFVMLIGEGPKRESFRHEDIIDAADIQAHFASLYGWYFYNALKITATWDELDAKGQGGDGIHLHGNFYKQVADGMWGELVLTNPVEQTLFFLETSYNSANKTLRMISKMNPAVSRLELSKPRD